MITAQDAMRACAVCPRACRAPRSPEGGRGFCRMGSLPVVARAALHHWEEPCISGTRGSGTVFFSGCALRCCFCQNEAISHGGQGEPVSIERLAAIFGELAQQGAHNLNLVTPTHFAPQIVAALEIAQPSMPVVYNTSGYESLDTLRLLDGHIDVYLPDLKYMDADLARRYSAAPDYPAVNQAALMAMCAQTGPAQYDADGLMTRGTMIRHLVLPGLTSQSLAALDWIAEHLPQGTLVSLMGQYTPCGAAKDDPIIGRHLTRREYDRVTDRLIALGLTEGYVQALTAAKTAYIPPFDGTGVREQ